MEEIVVFDFPKNQATNIIKVIGVGGGGNNAVGNMFKQGIHEVSFALCNTDSQALSRSSISEKIQLGKTGLGAGNNPEKGRLAAEESIEEIKSLFNDNTKMAFITAGMGGGTGTGAAPVIASVAKSMKILTVGIITIPFLFEKKPKIIQALKGVDEMRKNVDALLVINNERLRDLYADGITTAKEAFRKADDILTTATKSIAEIITINGTINRDFCDVETVMRNGGSAIMSTGKAKGKHRLQQAILNALNSPLLNNRDIEKAQKILYVIYASEENPVLIDELSDLDGFMDELDPNIEVIWGLYDDNSLNEEVKITIIATGFRTEEETLPVIPAENEYADTIIEKYYPPKEGKEKEIEVIVENINPDINIADTSTADVSPGKKPFIERLKDIIDHLMEEEPMK